MNQLEGSSRNKDVREKLLAYICFGRSSEKYFNSIGENIVLQLIYKV
jgi:hypothetical protein